MSSLLPQSSDGPKSLTEESSSTRVGNTLPASELKLQDMLQIMDVARAMRNERLTVEQQFSVEETRRALRDRLMASARVSGSDVREGEVDAAIDLYFQNLHRYQDPPFGFQMLLAHLYVSRWGLGFALVLLAVICGYWFYLK